MTSKRSSSTIVSTIDGAFSALSALMRDAVDIELIDANPAARMRVRPADPRLDPLRGPVTRRAVAPAEIARSSPRSRPRTGRCVGRPC
jgi:hypothetical protein